MSAGFCMWQHKGLLCEHSIYHLALTLKFFVYTLYVKGFVYNCYDWCECRRVF